MSARRSCLSGFRTWNWPFFFLVYSFYLAVLFLVQSRNPALNVALLYPDCLQFILVPAYLFVLYCRDRYALQNYVLIRRRNWKEAFWDRVVRLPGETLFFWLPYFLLQAFAAILTKTAFLSALYTLLLELFLLLSVGLCSIFLNYRFHTRIGQLVCFLLLLLDYLQAIGQLFPEDGSLFYYPFITAWTMTAEEISRLAFLAVLIITVTYLLLRFFFSEQKQYRFVGRDLLIRALCGLPFGLLWAVFHNINGGKSMEEIWLRAYGCMPPDGSSASFLGILFSLVPFVVALLLFGNALAGKLADAAVLIFPRAGFRKNWWSQETRKLSLAYLLYYILLLLSAAAVTLCFGRQSLSASSALQTAGSLLMTNGLMILVLILSCNLWNLRRDPRSGMLLFAGLYALGLLLPILPFPVLQQLYMPGRTSLLVHTPANELLSRFSQLFELANPALFTGATGTLALLLLFGLSALGESEIKRIDIL